MKTHNEYVLDLVFRVLTETESWAEEELSHTHKSGDFKDGFLNAIKVLRDEIDTKYRKEVRRRLK